MVLQRSVKCSSVFFIIFLMCPRRTRLDTPVKTLPNQAEVFTSARRTFNDFYNPARSVIKFPQWPQYILRQKDEEEYDEVENGFDLDDDEIRKFKLWPNGVIPYYIDMLSYNDKQIRDRIRLFLNTVNGQTKLKFIELPSPPKDDKTRYVFFLNRRGQIGCADHSIKNFTEEGVQRVVLGYDCMSTGGELPEAVLAIVGVPPQHNAPDRDDYIEIMNHNIIPDKKYLFEKLKHDEWLFYDLDYDFLSAGHYHHHKYSVNGHATIQLKGSYEEKPIGRSHMFSSRDIKKIKMLYNYIVDNNEDKVPECEKLFRKGENFPSKKRKYYIEPRPKPKKYLNIDSNENQDQENMDDKDDNDDNDDNDNKDDNDDNDDNDNNDDKDDNDGNDDDDNTGRLIVDEVDQEVAVAVEEENVGNKLKLGPYHDLIKPRHRPKKGLSRIAKKPHVDPLTYLSDYQTGDDRRRDGSNKNNKTN